MHSLEAHIAHLPIKGASYYLSCSGGIDSMVLFHLLLKRKIPFHVLHVNYQLRGTESEQDAEFVAATCRKHRVPSSVRIEKIGPEENVQLTARKLRYRWYREVLNSNPDNRILLAHHADDQVETFFINLVRKAGVMGLAAMPSEHNGIIRPLLEISRKEIHDYALENHIEWREDSSNDTLAYIRNSWRNAYLPYIETFIPDIKSSTLLLVNKFQSLAKILSEQVEPVFLEINSKAFLAASDLERLDEHERTILFRKLGQDAKWSESFAKLKRTGSTLSMESSTIPFVKVIKTKTGYEFIPKKEPEVLPKITIEKVTSLPGTYDCHSLYLDKDKIKGKLIVRKPKRGDRMQPVGMHGSKLISDIIAESGISYSDKAKVVLLCDAEHILWCVGIKVGKHALANPTSTSIICVTLES